MSEQRIDWRAVLEALDLEPPDRTGKINCPDPEHDFDKTASCHLYEDGHFYCYGCGRRGSTIDLAMRVLGSGYTATVRYLARTLDVDAEEVPKAIRQAAAPVREIEYTDLTDRFLSESVPLLIDGHGARQLGWVHDAIAFATRRWSIEPMVLDRFGVRAAANALWIPHRHPDGRVVGVKVRNTSTGDKVSMKGSRFGAQLYRPDPFYTERWPRALVVEGEPDCWTAYANTLQTSVYGLPGGASTLRQDWADELVAKHFEITLCFDNDAAGESARTRFSTMLGQAADNRSMAMGSGSQVIQLRVPPVFKDFTEAINGGWKP